MEFYVQKDGQQYGPLPALQEELLHLSATPHRALSFVRNASAAAVILVLASCGKSPSDIQAEADRNTAKFVSETTALGEDLKAEKERMQAEYEQAKLRRAETDQKEAAAKKAQELDDAHRRRMQELDRKIASEQQKAKSLSDQKERDEKARQDKQAKADAKKAKEMAEATKKADEQAKLQLVAEQVYTSINLEPEVVLGPSLRPFAVTYEVKGEAVLTLRDLYQKKDWLGVYNLVDNTRQKELPSESLVRLSMSDFGDTEVSLVLRTGYKPRSSDEFLHYFKVWKYKPGYMMIDYSSLGEGKPHPDGGGYVLPWRFKHQHVFFALGDRSFSSPLREIERAYKAEVEKVETKLKLTDITPEQHASALDALDEKLIRDITDWIKSGWGQLSSLQASSEIQSNSGTTCHGRTNLFRRQKRWDRRLQSAFHCLQ